MKVCVVDLDRTVIFSERVLAEYPTLSGDELVGIEYKDGELISSTSREFFNWIKGHDKSKDNVLLIANTARSLAEFKRVEISQCFDYSIVSNGGWVLDHDDVAQGWKEYRDSIHYNVYEELLPKVQRLSGLQQNKTRVVDDSYVYSRVENLELCELELKHLKEVNNNIEFLVARDKVYVCTDDYSKAHAINWLMDKLGVEVDIVCGDAPVDIPMLKLGRKSVVPFHGEILAKGLYEPTEVVGAGAMASVDILKLILEN